MSLTPVDGTLIHTAGLYEGVSPKMDSAPSFFQKDTLLFDKYPLARAKEMP